MNTPEQAAEYQHKQAIQRFGKDTVFCIDAKKVRDSEGKWFIRAIIEANINGKLMWSAIESSTADDDSMEAMGSKAAEAINRIPDQFSDLLNRNAEQKPVTVIGIDPGFKSGDKSMIVTGEVTECGLKVTNIKDAREAFQRLKGTIGETPIYPGIEGKPPINPELLKPAE